MVVLQRFSILTACVFLFAGCGDGGSQQYQTFQPAGQPGSAMAAEPAKESAAGAAEAVVAAASGATGAEAAGVLSEPGAAGLPTEAAVHATGPVQSLPEAVEGSAQSSESAQPVSPGPADGPVIDSGVSGEVREIQLLVPQKRFRRERPSEAVRVSYDDIDLLKVLNMEPVPADAVLHFPEWLKSLDGKLVRIRGYMFPTFVATGLTEFALARDNGICCFVRQPKIYDIMNVQLADGETTEYIANRPFDVEGIFRIDPDSDQSRLSRLYRIEQARVLQ